MSPAEDAEEAVETDEDSESDATVGRENGDASGGSGGFLSRITGLFSGGGSDEDATAESADDDGAPDWAGSSAESTDDVASDDPVSPDAAVSDPFDSTDEDPSDGTTSNGADAGDDGAVTAPDSGSAENADGTGPAVADESAGASLEGDQGLDDPFEEMEGAFDDAGGEVTDPDDVWASLSGAEQRGSVDTSGERSYAEVSKHDYCERCEYFSGPPEIHCNHEGTDILEFLDMNTVRVVDCPVVAERKGLEQGRAHGDFADAGED